MESEDKPRLGSPATKLWKAGIRPFIKIGFQSETKAQKSPKITEVRARGELY